MSIHDFSQKSSKMEEMMRVMTIASGSSGNCIYVGNDNTHILIDTGISKKRVEEGLKKLDLQLSDINAILVTHEHSDHIQGLGVVERKCNIPIYATWGTINGIKAASSLGKMPEVYVPIDVDVPFTIDTLSVQAIRTSHDALSPCAYRITDGEKSFGLVTDLGYYDDYTVDSFRGCNCMVVESNHDLRMLETGPYPYMLKRRIMGREGHLSNEDAGKFIDTLLGNHVEEVLLGHLSKENNLPELAYNTVKLEIDMSESEFAAKDFKIGIAKRDEPSHIITF